MHTYHIKYRPCHGIQNITITSQHGIWKRSQMHLFHSEAAAERMFFLLLASITIASASASGIIYSNVSLHLTTVLTDIPSEAYEVDLSENYISEIPADVFNHL